MNMIFQAISSALCLVACADVVLGQDLRPPTEAELRKRDQVRTFTVLVVDEDGKPAQGVPMVLSGVRTANQIKPAFPNDAIRSEGVSDQTGRVRFEGVTFHHVGIGFNPVPFQEQTTWIIDDIGIDEQTWRVSTDPARQDPNAPQQPPAGIDRVFRVRHMPATEPLLRWESTVGKVPVDGSPIFMDIANTETQWFDAAKNLTQDIQVTIARPLEFRRTVKHSSGASMLEGTMVNWTISSPRWLFSPGIENIRKVRVRPNNQTWSHEVHLQPGQPDANDGGEQVVRVWMFLPGASPRYAYSEWEIGYCAANEDPTACTYTIRAQFLLNTATGNNFYRLPISYSESPWVRRLESYELRPMLTAWRTAADLHPDAPGPTVPVHVIDPAAGRPAANPVKPKPPAPVQAAPAPAPHPLQDLPPETK